MLSLCEFINNAVSRATTEIEFNNINKYNINKITPIPAPTTVITSIREIEGIIINAISPNPKLDNIFETILFLFFIAFFLSKRIIPAIIKVLIAIDNSFPTLTTRKDSKPALLSSLLGLIYFIFPFTLSFDISISSLDKYSKSPNIVQFSSIDNSLASI